MAAFPNTTTEGPLNSQNWNALGSYIIVGRGNPEKAVKGRIGAIFLREDGEPGKTIYVKGKGNGTTEGWEAFEGSKEGGFATIAEVVKEAEARAAADTALSGKISAEESARASGDSTEKASRENADSELLTYFEERVGGEESERISGDNLRVIGPASATNLDIAVYNGTTGKLIKDGGKTVTQVLERANHTGTQLASTISNFDTQVRTSSLNQMTAPTADLSINSHKLTKVLDPTEALDAANKEYVDAAVAAAAAGLSVKNPVSYATTAALTVTAETEKTLEGTAPLTVDGKTPPSIGDRVLVKNQVSEKQNGIYEVTKDEAFGGEGTFGGEGKFGEGSKWLLTRTSDADSEAEVKQGMFVLVTLGTANASTTWILTTENPIVIGTTVQTFAAFTAQPIGPAGGDLEGTYPNPMIKAGAIVNADINAAAEIAYSKLKLAASIASADLAASVKEFFPQNAEAGTRKIARGVTLIKFSGTSTQSEILEVTHGLGSTPVSVSVTSEMGGHEDVLSPRVFEKTSTKFRLVFNRPALGTSGLEVQFNWVAMT